jgi:aminomethyltransferase
LIPDVQLENQSDQYALFAIQGRNSLETLKKLTNMKLEEIPYYWLAEGAIAGHQVFISRTGYTGELGYEIGIHPPNAPSLWNAIMEAGSEFDIEPIGLAARDTLRLEMKYCLYGNDIDETTNPLEAGLGWITKLKKEFFIGQEKLIEIKKNGILRKLVGLIVEGRSIPRHGYVIYKNNPNIGVVTSGTISPMLQKGICMAYVAKEYSKADTMVEIEIRNKRVAARIVKTPFYHPPE